MKKIIFLISLIAFSVLIAGESKNDVSNKWEYELFINNQIYGNCIISLTQQDEKYITETKMQMNAFGVLSKMYTKTVETLSFEPLESYHETIIQKNGKILKNSKSKAIYNGKKVKIIEDDYEEEFEFKENFYISENIIAAAFKKNGYKVNYSKSIKYHSSEHDTDKLLDLSEKIIGKEKIDFRGNKIDVFITKLSFGPIKNMTNYYTEDGSMIKSVTQIMNAEMMLLLKN